MKQANEDMKETIVNVKEELEAEMTINHNETIKTVKWEIRKIIVELE